MSTVYVRLTGSERWHEVECVGDIWPEVLTCISCALPIPLAVAETDAMREVVRSRYAPIPRCTTEAQP